MVSVICRSCGSVVVRSILPKKGVHDAVRVHLSCCCIGCGGPQSIHTSLLSCWWCFCRGVLSWLSWLSLGAGISSDLDGAFDWLSHRLRARECVAVRMWSKFLVSVVVFCGSAVMFLNVLLLLCLSFLS